MEIVEGKKTGSKVYKIGSELYTIEKRHRKSYTILYIKTSVLSTYKNFCKAHATVDVASCEVLEIRAFLSLSTKFIFYLSTI